MMKTIDRPLVSVVTPVYNSERYLAECIESVLAQTYTNWEYLIINNCSTDRTFEIATRYAEKDSRICIHNNQQFVSALQNHHIAFQRVSAASKYCKVLHADDLLFPECLMRMVEVAEANPSVGIVGAYRLDDVWVNLDGLPYPSTVVPGREICRSTLLGGPYVFGSPTSLLIRSSFLRQRRAFYDESQFSMHADVAACYETLQTCDFGFVHQVLTYTRRHRAAQTSFAQKVDTYRVESLRALKKYGPIYLTNEEYDRYFKERIGDYYRFLAKSFFHLQDRQFWDYHKGALKALGCNLLSVYLVKAITLEFISAALCPYETSQKIIRLMKRYRNRHSK